MQPRSERPPARGDEAVLFHQHHRDLHRAIARRVNGSTQLVEDACQFAWMRLIDSQPDRDKVFGWLYVVALHEAYRLSGVERRDAHLDCLPSRDGDWTTLMTDPRTIDLVLEAREALRAVAALPERQRNDFARHVGGHSYREIAGRDASHLHQRRQDARPCPLPGQARTPARNADNSGARTSAQPSSSCNEELRDNVKRGGVRQVLIDLDVLSPGEQRDLANALLRAAWSAVLEETRIVLLDLFLEVDHSQPEATP